MRGPIGVSPSSWPSASSGAYAWTIRAANRAAATCISSWANSHFPLIRVRCIRPRRKVDIGATGKGVRAGRPRAVGMDADVAGSRVQGPSHGTATAPSKTRPLPHRLSPVPKSRLQRCGVWLTSPATRRAMPMGVAQAAADCPACAPPRQIHGPGLLGTNSTPDDILDSGIWTQPATHSHRTVGSDTLREMAPRVRSAGRVVSIPRLHPGQCPGATAGRKCKREANPACSPCRAAFPDVKWLPAAESHATAPADDKARNFKTELLNTAAEQQPAGPETGAPPKCPRSGGRPPRYARGASAAAAPHLLGKTPPRRLDSPELQLPEGDRLSPAKSAYQNRMHVGLGAAHRSTLSQSPTVERLSLNVKLCPK